MSQLINGFTNYKSLSELFQKVAQDMKKDGECILGGNSLLERFCKADGTSDRRTIKDMFDKIENPFIKVKSYNDLNKMLIENNYDFSILDYFFENNSSHNIEILGEPNYDERHECFFVMSHFGHIIFGEVEKAPYFSKHIKTNGKKYFVSIDSNTMVDADCEILHSKTFVSDDFFSAVEHMKLLLNNSLNDDYLDLMSDDDFLHVIKNSRDILEMMDEHWEETNKSNWKDEEIIPAIKEICDFNRKISDEIFKEIKEYINQYMFFSVTGYNTLEEFEDTSHAGCDNGDDLGNGYYFYKDAHKSITKEELDKYAILWIRSHDGEECSTVTKDSYDPKAYT
jgi:hypothetical protein